MKRKVIIEPWYAEEIHVHEPDCTDFQSRNGGLVYGASIRDVVEVGKISGLLSVKLGREYWIEGNLYEFCEMVGEVLGTSEKHIAEARGFIEELLDAGYCDDQPKFSDREISWLDWEMRSRVAELARECDDPFMDTVHVKHEPFLFVNDYLIRRGDFDE